MIKNKKGWLKFGKVFGLAFAALYIGYANFLNFFFTSDHVWAYTSGNYFSKPVSFLGACCGGRMTFFFYSRITYLMGKLGITMYQHRNFFFLILLITLAASYTAVYLVFEKYVLNKESKVWLGVILLVSFINPYTVELFVYMGWELSTGVLLTVLAFVLFTQKKYISTVILLFLGIGSYQSLFAVFMIYSLTWIFLEEKEINKKTFWKKSVLAVGITGATAFATILLTNIAVAITGYAQAANKTVFSQNSVEIAGEASSVAAVEKITLLFRIKKLFWKYFYTTFTEMGLLPKGFLFGVILILGIFIFTILVKKRERVSRILLYLLWFALINVLPVSIYFLTPKYDVFARIVWPIFITLSVLMLLPICLENDHRKMIYFHKGFVAIILAVVVYSTITAETNFFIANSLDEQNVMQVMAAIEHYEEETENKVTKIAARRNERAEESYPQIDTGYYNYAHKTMYDAWSDVELLIYCTNTYFDEIEMSADKYAELFGDKIWSTFNSDEQLVFDGDTLYWAVY